MKLSQVVMRWWRQASLWAMHTPGRYAALVASGTASGLAAGVGLAGTDHSLAEWLFLVATNWLLVFLVLRLVAPALLQTMRHQQVWREERRAGSRIKK